MHQYNPDSRDAYYKAIYRDASDEAILMALNHIPILPDESDASWRDSASDTWEHCYEYLALADIASERRLLSALHPLLEKACYGDPREAMRGLRHRLERIANPDWDVLADVCIDLAMSGAKGARYWAIAELGNLRDEKALDVLIGALHETEIGIVLHAIESLKMLAIKHDKLREIVLEALGNLNSDHAVVRQVQVNAMISIRCYGT